MRGPRFLPTIEHGGQKPVDGIFKVQAPMLVTLPHFRAHLDEEVDHGGLRSEDEFRVGGDESASHSHSTLREHVVDLAPDGALTSVDFLVDEHAGVDEGRLEPPHLAATQILIAKGQLHATQFDEIGIDLE